MPIRSKPKVHTAKPLPPGEGAKAKIGGGEAKVDKTQGPGSEELKGADDPAGKDLGVDQPGSEPNAKVKAVLGDPAGPARRRKKSAATKVALAGVEKTEDKSGVPKWKKAVLATMTALMLLNVAAPSVAAAQDLAMVDQPVAMEMVHKSEARPPPGTFNPLSMQLEVMRDTPGESPGELAGLPQAEGPGPASGGLQLDGAASFPELSPEVQSAVDRAMSSFEGRTLDILNRDATSMAHGQRPVFDGDALSDVQRDQMLDATVDMLKDMPAGAFSEQLTAPLKAMLEAGGADVSDFDQTPIGELGDYGAEIAKNFADNLREDHPAAFWSLAGAGAAAAGYVAYTDGSDGLADLGLNPEVSTDLFDDRLEIRLSPTWEKGFDNFGGDLGLRLDLGDHDLGAGVRSDDNGFTPRLSYRYAGEGFSASVAGDYQVESGDFSTTGRVGFQPEGSSLSLSAQGVYDTDGADRVTLRGRWTNDAGNLNISGGAGYQFDGAREGFTGDLSLGYQPSEDLELQVRGRYDDNGESRIGLGLTYRF